MNTKRGDRPDSPPTSAEERRRFEKTVARGEDDGAADDASGNPASKDRLTKSGRLKVGDVERIDERRR